MLSKIDIELFIFDLDGTIIDSKVDIANSVNYTLSRLEVPVLQNSLIYSYVGNGVVKLLEKVLASTNKKGDIKEALNMFLCHYENHLLDNTCLYPNIMETLNYFSGVKMALISNKPERFVNKILKGLSIDRFFSDVIGGDSLKTRKPDPDGINLIIGKLNADPGKTIIIGDSGVDILTGKRAGINTCGVSYGLRDRKELVETKADIIIDDILELKDHVKVHQIYPNAAKPQPK